MQAISLFTGAMGLDIGLKMAGIETVACCDFDPICRKTISANTNIPIFEDITKITPQDINSFKGVDLVAGGPPCQSWSLIGPRTGFNDARGNLVFEFGRIIDLVKPRFFIMENVYGMTTALVGKERALTIILNAFKNIGYHTVHGVLNAVDYGVAQIRKRLIIIGSRDNEPIEIPSPTHYQNGNNKWRTLRDAIQHLENDNSPYMKLSEKKDEIMRKLPEGSNWRNVSEFDMKIIFPNGISEKGGKTGCLRRLSYNKPSPTLLTSPGHSLTMFYHPIKNRLLSISEYRAIQGFPKDWKIMGNLTQQYRQVGNAVPPLLSEVIAKNIIR